MQIPKNRIGYGRLDAPFYFLGMEEAGKPDELETRLRSPDLQDLREAHDGRFGGRYDDLFHATNARLQPTWAKLIRALLVATKGYANNQMIRRTQAHEWGRSSGKTLLLELFPVASPTLSTACYKRDVLPARIRLIRDLVRTHKPRLLIAYGATYAHHYKRIFMDRNDWQPLSPEDPAAGVSCGNVALVPHPIAFGQTNARFERIGRWARQFV